MSVWVQRMGAEEQVRWKAFGLWSSRSTQDKKEGEDIHAHLEFVSAACLFFLKDPAERNVCLYTSYCSCPDVARCGPSTWPVWIRYMMGGRKRTQYLRIFIGRPIDNSRNRVEIS